VKAAEDFSGLGGRCPQAGEERGDEGRNKTVQMILQKPALSWPATP